MRGPSLRSLLIPALLALAQGVAPALESRDAEGNAFALERELRRSAGSLDLWPGFETLGIPLAIWSGERTYLFRHPSPPPEFGPVEREGLSGRVFPGRHEAVTANSSAEIGGVLTATLLLDQAAPERSPRELAALALHEAFHVFQRERHPGWRANDGDLFSYPASDAGLLALRRLETEALRRALSRTERSAAACWARLALDLRRRRFDRLGAVFSAYERGTELNEGLAAYIQLRAEGRTEVALPEGGFGAAEVRRRAYESGAALALLLDRFRPGWKSSLEVDDDQTLDAVLEAALADAPEPSGDPCAFTRDEEARAEGVAREDAAELVRRQSAERARFDGLPGQRLLVIAAADDPLWPRGFDPLNVERVEGGVLHRRFLSLGNGSGELEAIDGEGADIEVLTEGIGPHPLFNGVRRVVVAGLVEPEMREVDGRLHVRAPGLEASFAGARGSREGERLVVRLGVD